MDFVSTLAHAGNVPHLHHGDLSLITLLVGAPFAVYVAVALVKLASAMRL